MIEELRSKLNNAVSDDNLQHPDIIKLSEELDIEVVKEQQIINDIAIYKSAIDNYGEKIQCVVAMEECAELVQAISKMLRGENHNIEEEIADVEIMLNQLKIIFNIAKVEKIKAEKIKRLRDRIVCLK